MAKKEKVSIWTMGSILMLIFCPPIWLLMLFSGSLRKGEEKRQRKRHARAVRNWENYWNI